ncbi:MAG: hypothetical protein Q8P40_07495 [Nitrospirota bacterium]|nr:hypothetical protein [Nitrospirota bacterium]
MDLTIERMDKEMDCMYAKNVEECFIVRESDSPDYRSAVVLLRNMVEKKDTTSLEREALSVAVRLLRQNMEDKNHDQT